MVIASSTRRRSFEDEDERISALYEQQRQLGAAACVIGVDEVGRGSVAGPLTVAALALPLEPPIRGLDDSKKLSPARREELAQELRRYALAIGMAHIEADIIDRVGMAAALRAAMVQAIESCGLEPDLVLIDGRPVRVHPKERCIVGGDGSVACIAAASIMAKVTRDALMVAADADYPGYGFASNKGYASAEHIEAIQEKGLSPIHRKSFCHNFLQKSLF
ncbi:MAG: ribonuclease HII [Coriobacteriales bacterium]|jgi:ribonuclease HII|nr:ribonuclease HII [Coriobacteriales bacterium]